MATITQISRWGNSLGLALPKSVALEAQVDEGDRVDVSVKNGAIVIRPSRPTYSLDQLVAKITPRNRHDESDGAHHSATKRGSPRVRSRCGRSRWLTLILTPVTSSVDEVLRLSSRRVFTIRRHD